MNEQNDGKSDADRHEDEADSSAVETPKQPSSKEIGGRKGPEPVRYGDWEKNGRCIDF